MIGDNPENYGWPKGMDVETATWLCEQISKYLDRAPMPTWLLQRNLSYERDSTKLWGETILLEWMYAAIDRACAEIGAERVWRKDYGASK